MEITYQGLRIQLPLEGVIGVESFSMDASFNEHISVSIMLLAEEETIESAIHGIVDGDKIEVYEDGRDGIFFVGKITDIWMQKERGLCYLGVKALSYTMEWALAPVSQSFLNLDMTYQEVIKKVSTCVVGISLELKYIPESVNPASHFQSRSQYLCCFVGHLHISSI